MLLALALIFLPIIFDGQGSYQVPMTSRIPDPPPVAILPEPVQSRPVILSDSMPTVPDDDVPVETDGTIDDLLSNDLAVADTPDSASDATEDVIEDQETATITASEPDFTRNPPTLGPDGLPQGWSVRLGSFSDAANANNLMQRLQDSGYRAYTRAIESDRGELTGVFVGPWLDRARVETYQKELQSEFQLAGMIVRFQVTE